MWRSFLPFALLAVAVAVAAPVPAPSGKLAPIPAPDPDAADYDKPPKGALLRLGSRQMRHPRGIVGDYAADGRTLFTAGPGRVCEWDTDSNTLRRVYPLPDKLRVEQAGCTPDGRLVLVKDSVRILVFDRATKERLYKLNVDGSRGLDQFAASPDSKQVAVSTGDGHVRQFDLTSGKLLDFTASHPLPPPTPDEIADPTLPRRKRPPEVYSLAWSPDGKTIASCSKGEGVMAWNSLTGEERWSFNTGKAYGKIAFTADGKHLLAPLKTNTTDILVRLDATTGEKGDELAGFGAPHGLAASADGRFLCNGKDVWDVKADKRIATTLPTYWTRGLAISPDGKRVAIAPGELRVFDTATGKELFDDSGHTDEVTVLAVRPDAKQIATAGKDRTFRLWDATTSKQVKVFPRNAEPTAMAYSPDGKHLAVAVYYGLWVYDLATGKEVWNALGYDYGSMHLAYSPDGKTLAAGACGLTVHLFDAATGEAGRKLTGETNASNFPFRFAWTPDSTGIVAPVKLGANPKGGPGAEGDDKFRVVLWDVKTGERVRTLGEPADKCPPMVAISPDGKHVAIGGKAVSVADWKTGKEKWAADVTAGYGLAFDGDEHLYADGLKLDVKDGKKVGELNLDPKTLRALAIPPKGKTVLTASADDNTVVVWPR